MNNKIVASIKKLVGVDVENDAFDLDIITAINSAIMVLRQIGVGDATFLVSTGEETWSEYLSNIDDLAMVKNYIALRVRLLFDPPTSSTVLQAVKEQAAELEWRLNVEVDPGKKEDAST